MQELPVCHLLRSIFISLGEMLVNLLRITEKPEFVLHLTFKILLLARWSGHCDVIVLENHVRRKGHCWQDEMRIIEILSTIILMVAIITLLPVVTTVVWSNDWRVRRRALHLVEESV